MNQLPAALRKVAVLVAALDDRAADDLLDQIGAEAAAKVRSAIMQLDDVPAAEQDAVLAEFLRGQNPRPPGAITAGDGGVELALSTAGERHSPLTEPVTGMALMKPLEFLRNVPSRELARVLAREHVQTIAVVVAQLEAQLAAGVLEQLPADLATDVLERLAWLEEPAPEALAEIARQLRLDLAHCLNASGTGHRTLAGVQALVAAMDLSARERVLGDLRQKNKSLARLLGFRQEMEAGNRPAGLPDDNYEVSTFRYRLARPEESARSPRFAELLALDNEV